MEETPEQMLERATANMRLDSIDVEADKQRRDFSRSRAEQSDIGAKSADVSLPSALPVENSIMRSLGPEGPNFVRFAETRIKRDKITGEEIKKLDDDGIEETVYEEVRTKKKISPYMIGLQSEASNAWSAINEGTRQAAIAWSYQKGEGDLDLDAAAKRLEGIYPKQIPQDNGTLYERPAFTVESVDALLSPLVIGLTSTQVDAALEAIVLAFDQFSPEVTQQYLEVNCSYLDICRILGKIFFLNSPMRDRFLA